MALVSVLHHMFVFKSCFFLLPIIGNKIVITPSCLTSLQNFIKMRPAVLLSKIRTEKLKDRRVFHMYVHLRTPCNGVVYNKSDLL